MTSEREQAADEVRKIWMSGKIGPLYQFAVEAQTARLRLEGALRNMIREWCEVIGDETVNGTPADTLENARAALEGKDC